MAAPAEKASPNLFIQLGEAEVKEPRAGMPIVKIGGLHYDATPYLQAYGQIGAYVKQFTSNPYDPMPLIGMQQLTHRLIPSIQRGQSNPHLRATLDPLAHGLASYAHHAHKLIGMRMQTAHKMARAPKTVIPLCINLAAGATATGIRAQNPYLGATGGATGGWKFPWTITKFQTSNNESGQLMPIRLTQLLVGGHDFVAASLAGLIYTVTAAPATLGWPAAMFAVTKTKDIMSTLEFWNLVALSGEGVGFGSIMSETGFFQIAVNNGGSGTFIDTWPVYANASLCGSPFDNGPHTQAETLRHAFAPLAMQGPLAMRMAYEGAQHIRGAFDADDSKYNSSQLGAYSWITRTDDTQQFIGRFVDSDPMDYAVGSYMGTPAEFGVSPDRPTGGGF